MMFEASGQCNLFLRLNFCTTTFLALWQHLQFLTFICFARAGPAVPCGEAPLGVEQYEKLDPATQPEAATDPATQPDAAVASVRWHRTDGH